MPLIFGQRTESVKRESQNMTTTFKFRRRYWSSPRRLVADLAWPFAHRADLRHAMRNSGVSPAFRERLMLAVTQVNACRYCSQFHAQEALKAGISAAETRAMLEGDLGIAPADELPALLYAQHWADSDGRPDPAARSQLDAVYGAEQADAIDTILSMIRLGNLAGNTADYWLYRLTFGRYGLTEAER
jgi:AhpD family alkylhydroperoxidase